MAMLDDLNEVTMWGLTWLQTGVICGGGFMLFAVLMFLKTVAKMAQSTFLMGIALVMMCVFFGTVAFFFINA
jgi:hypothetical protein